jgi:Ca2+-transporting ATPase
VSALTGLFANPWLWASVAAAAALQLAVIYLPVMQRAFGTVALDAGDWLLCTGVAASVVAARELEKLWRRGASHGSNAPDRVTIA